MGAVSKLLLGLLIAAPALAANGSTPEGPALYRQHCAQCHDHGVGRAPPRSTLEMLSQQQILRTLESGVMRDMGARRTPQERLALAQYLAQGHEGHESAASGPPASATLCRFAPPPVDLADRRWTGWGPSPTNERFQPAAQAGLAPDQVRRLKLRWAFGFPGEASAAAQPTVVGHWVFVGSTSGRVYALDLRRGCIYWTFDADQQVRGAISVMPLGAGNAAVLFADSGADVYSLDAKTGHLRWKRTLTEDGTRVGNTGSVTLYQDRLYVPLLGGGEGVGEANSTGCCKAHGALAALDAASGRVLWQSSVLLEQPHVVGHNSSGGALYGPSGANVWSAPTIDASAHRVYVATGDGHSNHAGDSSDSIVAFDMESGRIDWVHQATFQDAYTGGCDRPDLVGCPYDNGPDFDFGEAPALVSLGGGKRLLVIGQKSGLVYGFDPDARGRELWRTRVGTGSVLGGIGWGVATDGRNAYVAVSDHIDIIERDAKLNPHAGGLVALRLSDGKQLWRTNVSGCDEHEGTLTLERGIDRVAPPDFGCSPAQSAAVTVIPGVVFSGSQDGHLRAYASESGRVLWDFDTARDFDTVNYLRAHGGSIDVGGPAVVDGMVLTESGYTEWGELPGNVLLAFSVDGR